MQALCQSGKAWSTSLQLCVQTQGFMYNLTSSGDQCLYVSTMENGLTHPITGPSYTGVKFRIQAPFCFHSSKFSQGHPVGSLSNTSCSLLFRYTSTAECSPPFQLSSPLVIIKLTLSPNIFSSQRKITLEDSVRVVPT